MTPAQIILQVAALMNDVQQSQYTSDKVLPYLNIAMADLQEVFEQNKITYTLATSSAILVPTGTTTIAKSGGSCQLPTGLIEIRQLYERQHGVDPYTPMTRVNSLPKETQGPALSQFLQWEWQNGAIVVFAANQDIDLKIDYVRSMFLLPYTIDQINIQLPFDNCIQYLSYRTAALCSMYIGENETRANILGQDAQIAVDRALGIWAKGKQATNTRRRPFRAGWKLRGVGWN